MYVSAFDKKKILGKRRLCISNTNVSELLIIDFLQLKIDQSYHNQRHDEYLAENLRTVLLSQQDKYASPRKDYGRCSWNEITVLQIKVCVQYHAFL